jgi:hypothetical protein
MYQRAKIYKITDLAYTECYYGSTCQPLSKRMGSHRSNYKLYKEDKYTFTSSYILFDKYGVENCKIELVEDYECKTREELHQQEGFYIRNNPCVNKLVAGRTKKEYKKEYDQDNKEKILEQSKEYYQANKEKIREKRKEKVNCNICGKEISRENLSKHKKLHNK